MTRRRTLFSQLKLHGACFFTTLLAACSAPRETLFVPELGQYVLIANDKKTQRQGFSKTHAPKAAGILFVLPTTHSLWFTMVDTWIPLNLYAFDENQCVIHVQSMPARAIDKFFIPADATWALETQAEWGIEKGTCVNTIRFPDAEG